MATEGEKLKRLRLLLQDLFDRDGMVIFLRENDYREVLNAVTQVATGDKFFYDICSALYQLGLIEEIFFVGLTKSRPKRVEDIRKIQEFWFSPEPVQLNDRDISFETRRPSDRTVVQASDQDISFETRRPSDRTVGDMKDLQVQPIRRLVDWQAGARAYLEVFGIGENAGKRTYNVRRLTPWTACVRPPVQPREDFMPFDAIKIGLDELAGRLRELDEARGAGQSPDVQNAKARDIALSAVPIIEDVGAQLYQKIHRAGSHFEFENVFVELGIDESVSQYPWELMYDFKDLLCMKNYVGRFLNAAELSDEVRFDRELDRFQKLRVLLIEVSKPAVAGFEGSATAIEKEGQVIEQRFQSTTLTELKVLRGSDATFENFTRTIRNNFHIIHFCGYSKFNSVKHGANAEGA